MNKTCVVCEHLICDGDEIVAVIQSVFREIPSKNAFAIEKPTECFDIWHLKCSEEWKAGC